MCCPAIFLNEYKSGETEKKYGIKACFHGMKAS
jgi:hypothetical protein